MVLVAAHVLLGGVADEELLEVGHVFIGFEDILVLFGHHFLPVVDLEHAHELS